MPEINSLLDKSSPETVSSDSGHSDFEAIRKKVFGYRDKPTKRKSPKKEAEEIKSDELEQIFASENWEEVAALYFNTRFAVTGWEGFLLEQGQKKTLAVSLSTCMKMLLKIDPAYIALIVFTANFGGIIAQKEMLYHQLKKEAEKREGKTS